MRGKHGNGSANDVAPLLIWRLALMLGHPHEYSQTLSLGERERESQVDAQGYFRGQWRTRLKSFAAFKAAKSQ